MNVRNWIRIATLVAGLHAPGFAQAADAAAAPETWQQYMQKLVPLGETMADRITEPDNEQLRQEMYKFLHQMLSQSYFELQYQDPKYPDFWPMFNQVYPIFFANPDDSYYQAVVEDNGVYRISGYRGSTRIVDFEIGSGLFVPYANDKLGPTLAHYDLDKDVTLGKDGYFEVILSHERPAGYSGDWWQLGPGATFIWVRQIAYDWAKEVDGRFAIERLDVPAARPRDSAARIAAGMQQMPVWAEAWANSVLAWMEKLRDEGLVNKVMPKDLSGTGGITTQRYIQGMFDIGADEALILETEVPECRYWMFQLTDELTNTLDPMHRHSTLNGHTARLDADGKFRAVISAQDPGVPNWLDVVGYQRGMVMGRWLGCDTFTTPQVTRVKVADVRRLLPRETPAVTPEQRDATIRERRKAAQLRRRW